MQEHTMPTVDRWYQVDGKGQPFVVIAWEAGENAIEIQYFDGSLEELDLESWRELDLHPVAMPENWSGALDVGSLDDLGTEVTDTTESDWLAPMEEIPEDHRVAEADPAEDPPLREQLWEGEL